MNMEERSSINYDDDDGYPHLLTIVGNLEFDEGHDPLTVVDNSELEAPSESMSLDEGYGMTIAELLENNQES